MAPRDIDYQTRLIVSCFFEEDGSIEDRGLIEPDGVGDDDPFDPVLIADKLRELGDDYDEKVIQPLINKVQKAAKDQMATAFGDCVDSLCKSWMADGPEVTQEKQLLKASVMLGLYVKKKCPDLRGAVQDAMANFLTTRLGSWVSQQGGWDEVASQ
ncbi:bcl-2-like protein 15 [Anguilla anguilla]|uniref:bcl-2-like protein 15 n=1 Tax=Anguilla anguilla TaxID=7936 RepID=UPI0015AC8A27|nr:bcl-2-like protein 15 [Anguilla anguilla]